MRPARPSANDQGETLIELIIAIAIMGIAVVAIVSGIVTSILMSDVHRKEATAGAYVRSYAEAVEKYVTAGNYDASGSPNYTPATVGFTAPAGFTASVTGVQCWSDSAKVFGSCSTDVGVQKVTLAVATNTDTRANESLVVIIRKP
jgi:type II secretory pathway pseudopilin PulG